MKKYIIVSALLTAALSCSGGGGGGGGGGGQPEYPYLCTNGTPAGGGSSTENEQRCSACNTDHRLVDAACRREYPYVCTNGTAVAEKSLNENEQRCSACDMGWLLNPDTQVCDGDSYDCPNGLPREGMPSSDGADDGDIACISCNTGWRPEDTDFDGEKECLENHYTCPNGTPRSDNRPAVHETAHCASCDETNGYKLTTLDPPDCKRLGAVYIWVTGKVSGGSFDGRITYVPASDSGGDALVGIAGADAWCKDNFQSGYNVNLGSDFTVPAGYPITHKALLASATQNPVSWGDALVPGFRSLPVKKPASTDITIVDTWPELFEQGNTISTSNILVEHPLTSATPPHNAVLAWTGLKVSGLSIVRGNHCNSWTNDASGTGHYGTPYHNTDIDASRNTDVIFANSTHSCTTSGSRKIICISY